jgi:hypothetical protein
MTEYTEYPQKAPGDHLIQIISTSPDGQWHYISRTSRRGGLVSYGWLRAAEETA